MPVQDINAVQMGIEATNFVSSAESFTGFWSINPDLIIWTIVILFLLLMVFVLAWILPFLGRTVFETIRNIR